MINNTSNEWWADYEKDESILVDLYHSLHLELDDELDQFTTLPPRSPSSIFYSGVNPWK